jgi:hypothetical protein
MKVKSKSPVKPNDSSVEIGSSSDTSSDSVAADGAFDEGKGVTHSVMPIFPTPVRILVGGFSALAAVGGCVMSVIGANGLYEPADPNPSLHRGLLGGGLCLLAMGGVGVLSTFVKREHAQSSAAHA